MKRLAVLFFAVVLFTGCTGKNPELERAMTLRAKLLASDCSFDTKVTADYADQVFTFDITCEGNADGRLEFLVTAPESISGITGIAEQDSGKLTFTDTALTFPLLADGQVSPVSAPYLLMKTLRGGYLTAAGMEGELLRLTIDDSFEEDALQLDIWLNGQDQPVQADILYDGRRILTMTVSNFQIL